MGHKDVLYRSEARERLLRGVSALADIFAHNDTAIVPGGGLALLQAIDPVEKEEGLATGDERTGPAILKPPIE